MISRVPERILSVIIPVYNEESLIERVIDAVNRIDIPRQIIIVDDWSQDGTDRVIGERILPVNPDICFVRHERNGGKGKAIRTALENAHGEIALIQDADMEYDPQDYYILLERFRNSNAQAVYGSRFLSKIKVTHTLHYLVNRFLTDLTNFLYGAHLTDMETCYKMVRLDILRSLKLDSNQFEIEAEITAKLLLLGVNIQEVPIFYRGRNYAEGKKITWIDGFMTVWTLFRIRLGLHHR